MPINGGFEVDSSGWAAFGSGVTVAASADQSHSGTQSLKVVTPGSAANEGTITQTNDSGRMDAVAGSHYRTGQWLYDSTGNHPLVIGVEFFNVFDYLGGSYKEITTTSGWQYVEFKGIAPATTTRVGAAGVRTYPSALALTLYLDEVVLERTTAITTNVSVSF